MLRGCLGFVVKCLTIYRNIGNEVRIDLANGD